jgi:hypothetical protein
MTLIPFDRVTLVAPATAEDILQRLRASVGQATLNVFAAKVTKPFLGKVGADGFRIRRNINYRNSWMPVLVGRITQEGANAVIRVRLRLVTFVLVFTSFWIVMATFGALAITWRSFSATDPSRWISLLILVFPAFGYALCMGGFLYERKRSLKELKELLQAVEV